MEARPTLGAWDFLKKEKDGSSTPIDRTARIKSVDEVTLKGVQGKGIKAGRKPVITLEDARGVEWQRKLVCGVTICETIAGMYGPDVRKWPGKLITLYGTTTRGASGGTVECVRIRPERPKTNAKLSDQPTGPVDEAMRERQVQEAGGAETPPDGPREPGSDDQ